jgi:hypothetical protein
VIAWQLEQRWRATEESTEPTGRDADLRKMTGAELSRHLARLGA